MTLGTIASAASDNAARIMDALSMYDEVECLGGDFFLEAPIQSVQRRCLKGAGNLYPLGNFPALKVCGGALIHGALRFVTRETTGFNTAAILVDGNEEAGGDPTNFRPPDRTEVFAECVGSKVGAGNGSAMLVRSLDGMARVMGLNAKLNGEGFDNVFRLQVGATVDMFITANKLETPTLWGQALQPLVMESLQPNADGINGNHITVRNECRGVEEQAASPVVTCGRYNKIIHFMWDWFTPSIPRCYQNPATAGLNWIDDEIEELVTVTATGDALLRTSKNIIYKAVAHYFRDASGTNVAWFGADKKLTLLNGLVLAAGKKIALSSAALTANEAGACKEIAIDVDGVEMLVKARPKI